VQEISYIAVGALFGVPPHLSLGVSLLRRARDSVIGAPALGSSQAVEARNLKKTAPAE
jgi:hypothetical protein